MRKGEGCVAKQSADFTARGRNTPISIRLLDNQECFMSACSAARTGKHMKTIALTSGKGGVGKSNIAINLAITLAKRGSRVCVLDADTGLANINILVGVVPHYTLEHVFSGEKTLADVTIKGPGGIQIIPGASGVADCVDLGSEQQEHLLQAMDELEPEYDYLIVDTGAGISATVLHFVAAAQMPILVLTPEPTSLTDAFSLLKVLRRNRFKRPVQVLVNKAPSINKAHEIFKRFQTAVDKFIGLRVRFLGTIWRDQAIEIAVSRQYPVALGSPTTPACQDFNLLADNIDKTYEAGLIKGVSFSQYWQRRVDKARRAEPAVNHREAESTPAPASEKPDTVAQLTAGTTNTENPVKASSTPATVENLQIPNHSAPAALKSLSAETSDTKKRPVPIAELSAQGSDTASPEEQFSQSVWATASDQLLQLIRMGKVSRAQVIELQEALDECTNEHLPSAAPASIQNIELKKSTAQTENSPAPSAIKQLNIEENLEGDSANQAEPVRKHTYDESTFGSQEFLLKSLREANEGGSTPLMALLETARNHKATEPNASE